MTFTVPPAAGKLLVLPSVPDTIIVVALVAATVSVEVLPAVMVVGFAAIVTVGADGSPESITVAVAVAAVVPAPVAVAV
jgi:hypothetical protein